MLNYRLYNKKITNFAIWNKLTDPEESHGGVEAVGGHLHSGWTRPDTQFSIFRTKIVSEMYMGFANCLAKFSKETLVFLKIKEKLSTNASAQ